VADKGSTSSLCFKIFGTGLILAPALGIAMAATGNSELGRWAVVSLVVAGIALVVALIALIWGE
jgi:hypothetical protein